MKRRQSRLRQAGAALLLAALTALSGAAEIGIRGAGATFPYPLYAKWAAEYKRQTGVDVSYEPVGSGAGVERIERHRVDFGATDMPMQPAELQRAGLTQFPATIGGVVPVINITGIGSGELRLTGEVLGDIYLGHIRKWNDPAITRLNPNLKLPGQNITVAHRADVSGTTFLWSQYLAQSNPRWTLGVGAELAWPLGVGGVGNEGVASYVQRTKVSIGYVEFAYAKKKNLTTVSLRNHDGVFVKPARAAFEAAASAAGAGDANLMPSMIDAAGPASWPVTGATFILLRTMPDQPARSLEVMKFFDWAYKQGQTIAEDLDFVPLPRALTALIGPAWTTQVRDASGAAIWTGSQPP